MTNRFARSKEDLATRTTFSQKAGAVAEKIPQIVAYGAVGMTVGALLGAAAGEIVDHIPYINHIVPEGFGYIAAVFGGDATHVQQQLTGDLDKAAAAVGAMSGLYDAKDVRTIFNYQRRKN